MTGASPVLAALEAAWVGVLGACIGSFLNVVIARVPAGESIVRPRSRCPRCRAAIAWHDNLPVVSWLALRGRCRSCGTRIPVRYPVVELLGAALALAAWARHGLGPAALAEFALAAALLALAAIDLDTWLLPNAITWPVIAAGLAASALGLAPAASWREALFGAGLGFAAFALISVVGERLLRREALGFGDVWLLAGFGAWFGPVALLPIVLLASVQGSVVGLLLIAAGRGQPGPATPPGDPAPQAPAPEPAPEREEDWVPPRHAVPFGPFLVAGALEWLYLGDWLARVVPGLAVFR